MRAYKIFIVGVRNLIVEVDARYIKGMLNNPDIAPSASINCWIVSILTFHFELRHVPGTRHGPNGLSWRPPHPGDLSDKENPEDFDDWVDNLYGFIHLLNPPALSSASFQLLCVLTMEQVQPRPKTVSDANHADPPIQYYQIPWLGKATFVDKRLEAAHDWLVHFERLSNVDHHKYNLIIRYASGFFMDDYVLWKCDPQGAHK